MSTVNAGGKIITNNLIFALDGDLSVSYVKTPKQLSGCIAWFDASTSNEMVESSNIVSAWNDKSGNNYSLNSAQLSNLPANNFSPLYTANAVNGLGSLYFDGSNDYMYVNSGMGLASAAAYTSFVVLSPRYLNAQQVAVGLQNSAGTWDFLGWWLSLNTFRIAFDGGGNGQTNTTSRNDGRQVINSIVRNGSTVNAYLNGLQYATNASVASTVNSGVSRLGVGAGTYLSGTDPYKGYVCEIIIYNRALSDTERKQIEQYLGAKWAIPLSLTTSVTSIRDISNSTTLNAIYPTTYPILQHPYKDAIEQNAYGDYFTFNSNTSIQNIGKEPFTIEWIGSIIGRVNGGTNYVLLDNGEVYQTRGVVLRVDGGSKRLYLRFSHGGSPTTTDYYDSPVLVTGRYYHYLISYDGTNVRFYLDGVLTNSVAFTTRAATSTLSNFYPIGSTQCLQGETLSFKLYNKSFTAAEVTYQYELEKNRIASMRKIVTDNLQIWLDSNYHSSYPNSGTSFYDLTNNQNYFQLTSSPTFVTTEPRTFSLSGASQYFLYYTSIGAPTGNTGLALPSTNSWTCAFWFRTSTTNSNRNPLLSHMGSGPVYCLMGISNSVLIYYHYDGNNGGWLTKTATTNVADDNWHNVVYVNTNNTMTIYLDGVLEKSSFSSTTTNPNNYVNGLGGSWESVFFNGSISNFMYYNTNLTDVQILQNYNAQKYRFGR